MAIKLHHHPIGSARPAAPLPRAAIGFALLAALALPARADIKLPAILGSNMVVPCDVTVPVWGRATPGEHVLVEFRGQALETRADARGDWQVRLAPLAAADDAAVMTITGNNKLKLTNVLVGETWLCSGQSNMTLRVDQAGHAKEEMAAARLPRIRLFTVRRRADESGPRSDCEGKWVECSPETVGEFSAVGFFFGRELHQRLGRAVGLIHSSWGGTRAEAWTPRETLAADPAFRPILDAWRQEVADFPRRQAEFAANKGKLMEEWRQKSEEARAAGRMPPSEPRLRTGPNTQYAPSGLYNAMIAPLAPFALRGVIWYQGEANVASPRRYQRLFPAMINAWRDTWSRPDLPFLYVQLPNLARQPEPSRSGWAEMREAQLKTLAVPHTAMAVTIDVGDPKNLHPTNKQPVGRRLALAAEALVYCTRKEGEALCPVPGGHAPTGTGALRVEVAPREAGLKTSDGQAARGFVVAGEDQVFRPAEARFADGALIVHSNEVPRPVAVRYAWADNPEANVVSLAGLPLSPFRTDDWPTAVTAAEK